MNTLKNTILSYSGIVNEEKASVYADNLYKKVISKIMNQSNLDNVSYINFNNARIEQAKRAKDYKMYGCKDLQDFVNQVLDWLIEHKLFKEQDRDFIIKAATDYYNKFSSL